MLPLRESCHHEISFDAKKLLFRNLHQNEQFKVPKLSNASSSKQIGNQATSFPPFYKTAENQDKHLQIQALEISFKCEPLAGFGQGSSQSEI